MLQLLAFTTWISIGICAASAKAATNLEESFQSALNRSETLASQEKQVEIAEARYAQARGSILPKLGAYASYTVQDRPADQLAQAFFPRTQPEVKLTLRQPIFQGFREFAALRQYSHLSEGEKRAHDQATLLLYSDVAQSYHAVLVAEGNLKNIEDQLKLYDDRISELVGRVRAGTSSQTDLLTLQSARAAMRAQLDATQAGLVAARESFTLLTGLSRDVELASVSHKHPKPEPVESYLAKIEERPDVQSITQRTEAADALVTWSKGAHWPSIDLFANYYFKRQSEVYNGINWDVQAAVSLPIFSGGVILAQVRESTLERERAELDLSLARRQAESSIRSLHREYLAALSTITALEQSLELAEKNYQLLKRDYRRGLTRNLDVLQALISSHETRRTLLRARYAALDTWVRLSVAAGMRPES